MAVCSSCSSDVPAGKRFCADCGTAVAPVAIADDATRTSLQSARRSFSGSDSGSFDESRFLPGTLLAERYRIVGLLGSGGMGEVYRADDLKLGQAVALKFLPGSLAQDEHRQARFLNEAKVALKVTHPNVCRVYDIGEVEGHPYLSMEYIDGEDLASLLRRIGRLPEDKAVEIARQLCAGLAAAHDQGILHRDLKPANVMLDGRGRVRITDFGLAGLEEEFVGGEVRAGTPAYMSPEQLDGKEVTIRSDIYALGLVMYELFTGKPAFGSGSPLEMARLHRETQPTRPSSHLTMLDPAADSLILRCLEKDPRNRPASALAVSAALPGGDPLAAALAAGETPSPELVAAAGESEAMSPVVALAVAVLSIALFALAVTVAARDDLRAYVPMEKSPAVMMDHAREIVRELGYTGEIYSNPADTAVGYSTWSNHLDYIEENDDSPARWQQLQNPRPGAVEFWYRQSPVFYFPSPRWGSVSLPQVTRWNPFPDQPGEILVGMDMRGRLNFFVHTPKRFADGPPPTEEPDWTPLFELAGLDMENFERVDPRYQRYMDPEVKAAWVGRVPEAPEHELRIEAAMHAGRPVLFGLLWPWEIEVANADPVRRTGFGVAQNAGLVLFLVVLIAAAALARRNLRRDRADRRGAIRLMVVVFVVRALWEILRTHAGLYGNLVLPIFVLASALFGAVIIGTAYIALEPYARRIWPTMLTSWSRLMGGETIRWRDPSVGRSVLWGLAGGVLMTWLWPVGDFIRTTLESGPVKPPIGSWTVLLGQKEVLAQIADSIENGLTGACFVVLLVVLARFLVRSRLLAAAVVVAVVSLPNAFGADNLSAAVVDVGLEVLSAAILIFVLVRFGFLSGVVAALVYPGLSSMAATHDWTAWYARPAITALVFVAALASYGYWAATAGRRLIPEEDAAAPPVRVAVR